MGDHARPTEAVRRGGRNSMGAPSDIEDAQGYTESQRAYDDYLADLYAEDVERDRIEGHWPAEVHRPVSRASDDYAEAA